MHDQLLEGGKFDDSFLSEDPEKIVYNNTYAEHIAYLDSIVKGVKMPRPQDPGGKRNEAKLAKENMLKQFDINNQRHKNKGHLFWLNGQDYKGSKRATF